MLIPAEYELIAYQGATFETTLKLWKDAAQTEPFSLTGYTVKLNIIGVVILTSGSGLTITAAQGEIAVAMTATATAAVTSNAHYYLILEKESKVLYPLHGTMAFRTP